MKKKRNDNSWLPMAILTVVMAGCQQDDRTAHVGDVVRLTAGIAVESEGVVTTRATDITESQNQYFDANTCLQAYVYQTGTYTAVKTLDNVTIQGGTRYKTAAYIIRNGTTINVMNLDEADKEPSFLNITAVDIVAVHPTPATATFTSTASNPFTFSVNTSQTTADAYKMSDLMVATTTNKTSQDNPISLPFEHKMAKITVTYKPGTGAPAITKVEILGIQPTVTFNCQTGAVSAATGTATAITVYDDRAGSNAEYTASAIVPPQTAKAANTDFIRFTFLGGGTAVYPLPAATTFTAGNNYAYNLTVNATAVTGTASITTAWQEGEVRDYSTNDNEKITL